MKARVIYTWIGSRWGVFFASMTALWVGLFLGAIDLALREVSVVDYAPRKDQTHKVVFVRGRMAGGSDWQKKLEVFLEPDKHPEISQMVLNEGHFNLFLSTSLQQEASAKKNTMHVEPNVRISGGVLQLGLLITPGWSKHPICFQSRGTLKKTAPKEAEVKEPSTLNKTSPVGAKKPEVAAKKIVVASPAGADVVFEPQSTYLGALPIPNFLAKPIINAALKKMFSDAEAAKLATGWNAVQAVRVDGDLIRITL